MQNLFDCFLASATRSPERVAVIVQGKGEPERFTYGELRRMAAAVAADLRKRGVEPGDRCAILAANHARWCAAFLGILELGAVAVPLDTAFKAEQISILLRDSGARLVFAGKDYLSVVRRATRACAVEPELILLDGCAEGHATLDQLVAAPVSNPLPACPATRDDTAVILYTSGTTADPKGVVLTHANLLAEMEAVFQVVNVHAEDCILGVLPLFHALALLANLILPLAQGASAVFVETISSGEILRAMREREVTIFCVVPQFFYLVHQRLWQQVAALGWLRRRAFRALLLLNGFLRDHGEINIGRTLFARVHETLGPRLRLLVTGGSRFDPAIGRDFHRLGFDLLQAYGLTECAGAATVTPPRANRIGSVGRALPGIEVKILPVEVPVENGDQVGEIAIRGPIVMRGYYDRPEATAAALQDGFLRTGDLGYFDAEGNLYITGRLKEVIVLSSGKNIYPEEIEAHYLRSPYIKELCVLGRASKPGEPMSERLHAVVVPNFDQMRERKIVNLKEILRYEIEGLSIQLPPHKRILTYEIWQSDLPRTTTRKLKRFEIERAVARAAARAETQAERRELTEEELRWAAEPRVAQALAVVARAARDTASIHPAANLELDLGLDSMERVELLVALEEEFGAQVEDDAAARIYTVRELVDAVLGREAAPAEARAGRPAWESLLEEVPEDDPVFSEILKPKRLLAAVLFVVVKLMYFLARVLLRLRVEGREHLPASGPVVISPNHQSYLDPFLLVSALPFRLFHRLFFVGASEYFATPLMAWTAKKVNIIPIDPDTNLVRALQAGAFGLRHGKVLVLFPEGERSIDGEVKTFKKGAAILSTHLGVPILPVAIDGAFDAWPRGRPPQRLARVRLRFGAPLAAPPRAAADVARAEAESAYMQRTDELRRSVVQMVEELKRARA